MQAPWLQHNCAQPGDRFASEQRSSVRAAQPVLCSGTGDRYLTDRSASTRRRAILYTLARSLYSLSAASLPGIVLSLRGIFLSSSLLLCSSVSYHHNCRAVFFNAVGRGKNTHRVSRSDKLLICGKMLLGGGGGGDGKKEGILTLRLVLVCLVRGITAFIYCFIPRACD